MAASGLSEAKFKFLWNRLDAKIKKNCSGVAIGTIMRMAYYHGHMDGYESAIFEDEPTLFQKVFSKLKQIRASCNTLFTHAKGGAASFMYKARAVYK